MRFPMLAVFDAGQMRDCILGVFDGPPSAAGNHVADMVEQLL
jgi:hypothetical protein